MDKQPEKSGNHHPVPDSSGKARGNSDLAEKRRAAARALADLYAKGPGSRPLAWALELVETASRWQSGAGSSAGRHSAWPVRGGQAAGQSATPAPPTHPGDHSTAGLPDPMRPPRFADPMAPVAGPPAGSHCGAGPASPPFPPQGPFAGTAVTAPAGSPTIHVAAAGAPVVCPPKRRPGTDPRTQAARSAGLVVLLVAAAVATGGLVGGVYFWLQGARQPSVAQANTTVPATSPPHPKTPPAGAEPSANAPSVPTEGPPEAAPSEQGKRPAPPRAMPPEDAPTEPPVETAPAMPREERPPATSPTDPPPSEKPPNLPPPPPSRPEPTPEQVAAVKAALLRAREALSQADFLTTRQALQAVESLPVRPEHQAMVARLQRVTGMVESFWNEVKKRASAYQGGEEIPLGSTRAAVVEVNGQMLVLRVAGRNRRYLVGPDLPAGLAEAIAIQALGENNPDTWLLIGAFHASRPDDATRPREKARQSWMRAQQLGADLGDLMQFLEDDYEKIAP